MHETFKIVNGVTIIAKVVILHNIGKFDVQKFKGFSDLRR